MRIRLPLGRSLFFLVAFLFSMVALLPLRVALDWLALDERGFAAREAKGSIWLGGLTEAQLGTVPIGDVEARLRTLPLLIGRARVDLQRAGDENPFRGAVSVSRHSFGIDDVTARLQIGTAFAPLPIASLELGDLTARFRDGLCASADGLVKAALGGGVAGVALPGGLSGTARCDEGAVLLPMVSQSGLEGLALRLFEDGRYRAEMVVRPGDEAARTRLLAAGFAQTAGGYVLRVSGRF